MNFDPTASFFSMVIGLIVLILAVAAILMPLYVISMAGELKKMRALLERMEWCLKKAHEREEAAKELKRY